MEKLIEFTNVSKVFGTEENKTIALNKVSFTINEGEFCVILGPSGAGKTTLLNLLGGMDVVSEGKIVVNKKEISRMNKKELTIYRRNDVGFVFQFYNLMPNLSALENVELATEICNDALNPKEILKKVGLENRENHFPSQLSGGEQQRVSIARAIAKNPAILLCDEPTGALDYNTGKQILKLLQDINIKEKKTIIIVTHNSALKDIAEKVIYVKNGEITNIVVNEKRLEVEKIEW